METSTVTPVKPAYKLHKSRAAILATAIGSPAAATYLMRENYIQLGERKKGNLVFALGLTGTISFFLGAFFLLPDTNSPFDKILPILLAFAMSGLMEWLQGDAIKRHQQEEGELHSLWRTAGISALFLVATLLFIFTLVFAIPDESSEAYNAGLEAFSENESEALKLYNLFETEDQATIISYIDEKALPAWQENLQLVESMDTIDGLEPADKAQIASFRDYTQLRIASCILIKKELENPNQYEEELDSIHTLIEKNLEE